MIESFLLPPQIAFGEHKESVVDRNKVAEPQLVHLGDRLPLL